MSSSASARRWRSRADARGRNSAVERKPGAPARFERDLDRLAHGELGEQRRGLERAAEAHACPARAAPCRRDVVAEELDRARARHEAADGVHQRRLAGAVGADEADDLVVADAQRRVVDGDDAAEANGDASTTSSAGTSSTIGGRAERDEHRRCRAPRRSVGTVRRVSTPPTRTSASRAEYAICTKPTREVEEQDQQAEARGEQRHQLVVGEERRAAR